MTKKCLANAVWHFAILMVLIFGGREVCFGQQVVASNSNTLTIWSPVITNPNLLVNSEFFGDVHPSQTLNTQGREENSYNIDMWKGYRSVTPVGGYYNYIAQNTDPLKGGFNFIGMNHATTVQQTALVQFVENEVTSGLQGNVVSLSFNAESVASHIPVSGVTGAVLCWTGTKNSPTKPISTWGVTPTWDSSWYQLGSAINTGYLGTTWGYFKTENILVPNICNNLAVIFWTPTAEAAGTEYRLANIKLEQSASATAYSPDAPSTALIKLNRYVYALKSTVGYSNGTSGILQMTAQYPVTMLCANASLSIPAGGGISFIDMSNGTGQHSAIRAYLGMQEQNTNGTQNFYLYNMLPTSPGMASNSTHALTSTVGAPWYKNYFMFDCEL